MPLSFTSVIGTNTLIGAEEADQHEMVFFIEKALCLLVGFITSLAVKPTVRNIQIVSLLSCGCSAKKNVTIVKFVCPLLVNTTCIVTAEMLQIGTSVSASHRRYLIRGLHGAVLRTNSNGDKLKRTAHQHQHQLLTILSIDV